MNSNGNVCYCCFWFFLDFLPTFPPLPTSTPRTNRGIWYRLIFFHLEFSFLSSFLHPLNIVISLSYLCLPPKSIYFLDAYFQTVGEEGKGQYTCQRMVLIL